MYIDDDLTRLWVRLLCEKKEANLKRTWTTNWRIFSMQDENESEVRKTVDSQEDIMKLGWTEKKQKDMGIYFDQ